MDQVNDPISRVTLTRTQSRRGYDRLSRWYDLLAGSSEWPFKHAGLQALAVTAGEHVLEIGSGTGQCLAPLLASAGAAGRVHAVDLSGGMLRVARSRLQKAQLATPAGLCQADAAAMPYPPASMDAVFSSFTLELFDTPEIPLVLRECRRVLRAGGRIGIVSLSKAGRPNLMLRAYEWTHRRFPAAVDCRPIYAETALREAGFEILHKKLAVMWGLPVEIVIGRAPC
jgi:ubiquinone/menaquinone biosynthesis C-methylase UbiE